MSRAFLLFACLLLLAPPARAAPAIAVLDARADGVHAASAEAATRQLYATVARLGYRTVPEARVRALATRLPPVPPTPADLLRLARDASADHALETTIGARDGRYVVRLTLANADRTGPFLASETADAATLEAVTDRLVRSLLKPPPDDAVAAGEPATETKAARLPNNRFAVQTEGAFGLTRPRFYNHLFGVRYDYTFPGNFALGGYLGYINVKGKEGRSSNVLPYVQLEYRVRGASDGIHIPLRFGSGYLPKNGPFLRLAAGLAFPVGETTRIGFDIVTPTFWIVRDSTIVSLDVAAEVTFEP